MKIVVIGLVVTLCAGAQPLAVKLPPFTRAVLPNGVVLRLMPKADAPLLSLRAVLRGGAESDPAGLAGLSSVVASLLTHGTTTRTAEQFASELDFLGASIQGYVDPQSSTIELDVLPANASTAIALLAEAMIQPAFLETEVHGQLRRWIEMARSRKDSPDDAVWQYFRSFFFRPPHPYGRPFRGDQLTLERIGRAEVIEHYSRMYVGRNLILTVVGPFAENELRAVLTNDFRGLAAGRHYRWLKAPRTRRSRSARLLLVDKPDATQTQFVIGLPGIGRTNPDRVPLWLVNNILGGRFTSLLNERLRVEAGLTYGAYSYVEQDRLNGAITLHSNTATADTKRAIALSLDVLRRFTKEGVSAGQLAAARTYLKAAYPPENLQTAGQLADLLGELELYGLGRGEIDGLFARLDAVSIKEANRVLRHYSGAEPVLVVIGRAQELRQQIRGYASTIVEASITEPGFLDPARDERVSASGR